MSSTSSITPSAVLAMLQDFILAWRVRTVEEKANRFKAETRMRDMARKNNNAARVEATRLMIAVTFKLWKENVSVLVEMKRAERRERREAQERLARAKVKPSKEMLRRRMSVIDGRGGRKTGGASGRKTEPSGSMADAARAAIAEEERVGKGRELVREGQIFGEEMSEIGETIRVMKRRQMRALECCRWQIVRLRTASAGGEGTSGEGASLGNWEGSDWMSDCGMRVDTANGTLTDLDFKGGLGGANSDANNSSGGGGNMFSMFYQSPRSNEAVFFPAAPESDVGGRSSTAPNGARRGIVGGSAGKNRATSAELKGEGLAFLRRMYLKSREQRGMGENDGAAPALEASSRTASSRTGRNRAASAPSPEPGGVLATGMEEVRLSPVPFAY